MAAKDTHFSGHDMSVKVAIERDSLSATYFAAGNLNTTNYGNVTGVLGILFEGRNLTAELHSVGLDLVFVKMCCTHFDEICFDMMDIPVYDDTGNFL